MRQEKKWFPAYSLCMFGHFPFLLPYLLLPALIFVGYFLFVLWAVGRQNIGTRLFQNKQYAEAAEAYRRLLRWRLPAGIEADTRRRLSDALDSMGHTEEAAAERERAEVVSARSPKDAHAQVARGDLLKRKQQNDEACEAYMRALQQTPSVVLSDRATIMAKLSTAHYEAGRPVETVRWAESALKSRPNPTIRMVMHSMAGVGYADMGELDKAEEHYRRSLELAEADGKPEEIAQRLATLGDVQRKRGHFLEAISTGRRAVETSDSPFRAGRTVQAESLREMGRFDEARTVVAQMKQGPRHDRPDVERRMQAVCALSLAWVESAADRPDAALTALEEAREHLKVVAKSTVWPPPPSSNEDKLVVFCDATAMRVHAEIGQREAAQKLWGSVETYLPRYANDRATLMGIYANFARAAYYLDDLAGSRAFWQQHLDCKPTPVGIPYVHYWLGEIALRLGESDTAREAFRQAVEPGIDSIYARRAQARLDELGG